MSPQRPALELHVFPKPVSRLTTWLYQADPSKRFTDAELAAEYWRSSAGSGQVRIYNLGGEEKGIDWEPEAWVMGRFATRPHHDDEEEGQQ